MVPTPWDAYRRKKTLDNTLESNAINQPSNQYRGGSPVDDPLGELMGPSSNDTKKTVMPLQISGCPPEI